MQPTIAITPCRALPDYVESVRRAGGEPRVLDYGVDTPVSVLTSCHGVLFTGGGDVDPARYGEDAHASVTGLDVARDAYELDLARLAVEAGLPVLGICRGLQLLNVAFGGTLMQDIPSDVAGGADHLVKVPLSGIAHDVWVSRTSRLAALMSEKLASGDTLAVNSRHHQAVKALAVGFDVTATAPDGIIEAVERRGAPFCVAVQWHPENFWRTGEFRPLFEGFVAASQPIALGEWPESEKR
ncbi:MAG: gamma-glutamyl-gamma-aminobutyrate hydrolase family protein [Vicinamibacterales bacterium]|nr:gamma-glutamyl-gamma-aminobutyrate hydrolase family protein [Vicinamibacterales bacterium]